MFEELKQIDEYLDKFTNYASELKERSDKSKLEQLSKLRNISLDGIEKAGIFYVNSQAELLIPKYRDYYQDFGIMSASNSPMFHNRWIIPIKNHSGKVMNFVGYTNTEEIRYLYGNGIYYRRSDDLYGLENINEAYDKGYAILTEGITDCLAVRALGFTNTFAWCGTTKSPVKCEVLNRCRYGVIRIPDRDLAGAGTDRVQKFYRSIKVVTPYGYKDTAECLEQEFVSNDSDYRMSDYFTDLLNSAIEEIKTQEHKGVTYIERVING